MEIVTGYRGEAHITADDQQALNAGITGDCVLAVGKEMSASLTTSNNLRILDGTAVMGGVEFRILPGSYDDVTIPSGEQGLNRLDLVCAHYEKASGTGIESMSWVVRQGTGVSGTPVRPAYTQGNPYAGDTAADFPMYEISLTGLNATVTPLFSVVAPLSEITEKLAGLPRAIRMASSVINGTAANDVTLWTIPAQYDVNKITVDATNGDYNANSVQMISTYIDSNRRIHARINANRVVGWFRYNYIVWYWG